MDEWVKRKLQAWGLQNWQSSFEDEEVDSVSFKLLTPELIKKIIPKAGPQAKFTSFWRTEFSSVGSENTENIFFDSINIPSSSFTSETSEIQSVDRSIFPLYSGECGINDSTVPVAMTISSSSQDPESALNANPFFLIDSSDLTLHPCAPINNLIDTLRDTAEGVAILIYYKANRDLTDEHRSFLVEIILFAEIKSSNNLALTPERLEQISVMIKETFPTENIYSYYVPYRMDTVTRQKVCAKGKLYDRYNTHRSFLLLSKVTDSLRGTKRKSQDCPAPVRLGFRKDFETADCCTDDYEKKIEWLKNSIDPWSTVEKYWGDTSRGRIKELYSTKGISSETYIANYPALKDPKKGISLIELDFATLYPEKANSLHSQYLTLENEILTFCKTKKRGLDVETKILIKQIEQKNQDCNRDTYSNCAAVFQLLPLLFPPPPATKILKTTQRPSKSEVQAEFLLYVKTIQDLEERLSARRRKTLECKGCEQPLAVVVGKSLQEITESYVCINDIRYEVSSPLHAIDIAFKSFYSLQLEYPSNALIPWTVIQCRVYEIEGESDKIIPCVSKFLAQLRRNTS